MTALHETPAPVIVPRFRQRRESRAAIVHWDQGESHQQDPHQRQRLRDAHKNRPGLEAAHLPATGHRGVPRELGGRPPGAELSLSVLLPVSHFLLLFVSISFCLWKRVNTF